MAAKAKGIRRIMARDTRPLTVELTDEEWRAASASLGAAHQDLRAHEEHEEVVKKDLKAQRGEIEGRIGRLARLVHTRAETRSVECEVFADHDRGMAVTVRTDTGEEIARRPLTHDERQLPLVPDTDAPREGGEG